MNPLEQALRAEQLAKTKKEKEFQVEESNKEDLQQAESPSLPKEEKTEVKISTSQRPRSPLDMAFEEEKKEEKAEKVEEKEPENQNENQNKEIQTISFGSPLDRKDAFFHRRDE